MIDFIDEETLGNGMKIQWGWVSDVESPRTWDDNLGHMLTWTRRYCSPDENAYDTPELFMEDMLKTHFSFEELEEAVRSGMFSELRFERDEQGREHLTALYRSLITGRCSWDVVEEFESYPDADTLAETIAQCREAPDLLSQAVVLKTVYMLDHSGISYSTSDFCDRWDSGPVGFVWADEDDISSSFGGMPVSRDKVREILDAEVARYSQWANGETYAVMLSDADDNLIECIGGYIGDDDLEVGIADMRRIAATAA